jgi:hypothetical protein
MSVKVKRGPKDPGSGAPFFASQFTMRACKPDLRGLLPSLLSTSCNTDHKQKPRAEGGAQWILRVGAIT